MVQTNTNMQKIDTDLAHCSIALLVSLGALEWTRTTTPLMAQALNLLRIPFRHEGISFLGTTRCMIHQPVIFVNSFFPRVMACKFTRNTGSVTQQASHTPFACVKRCNAGTLGSSALVEGGNEKGP
jgi:hypothetical protein